MPVVVAHARAERYVEALRARLPDAGAITLDELADPAGVEVLLAWELPDGALDRFPDLRWIQVTGAGVDGFLGRSDLRPGIRLTRSLGRFGDQVAEYVVGFLLHRLLDVDGYRRQQERRLWQQRPRPLLADLAVGVVGLGSLGAPLAARLAAFGAEVHGVRRGGGGSGAGNRAGAGDTGGLAGAGDAGGRPGAGDAGDAGDRGAARTPDGSGAPRDPGARGGPRRTGGPALQRARPDDHEDHEECDHLYTAADWHRMLPRVDVVVLALPLTPETRGLVDDAALEQMRRGALLVNVGRGELLDEEALLEALEAGRLGGAILDVFATEPLPPGHPLWTAPGVTVTPHVAAPSEVESIAAEFAANYRRWRAGEPLRNEVDRERGY